jgi:hypothetical protein
MQFRAKTNEITLNILLHMVKETKTDLLVHMKLLHGENSHGVLPIEVHLFVLEERLNVKEKDILRIDAQHLIVTHMS